VVNHTGRTIRVEFQANGSRTLLPHFDLSQNQSRRAIAGPVLVVRYLDNRLIGTLDISRLMHPHSQSGARAR
jgi:hypothetical protein